MAPFAAAWQSSRPTSSQAPVTTKTLQNNATTSSEHFSRFITAHRASSLIVRTAAGILTSHRRVRRSSLQPSISTGIRSRESDERLVWHPIPVQAAHRDITFLMRALILSLSAVVLAACSGDSVHRLDTPASSPAASGILDPVLPKSATDIYYLDYAGGLQDLERFVRFTVPVSDLDSAIDGLIAANNLQFKRSLPYARIPRSAVPVPSPRAEFLPVAWWTPSSVRRGYYRGESAGYALQIWADTATGTVYFYQND